MGLRSASSAIKKTHPTPTPEYNRMIILREYTCKIFYREDTNFLPSACLPFVSQIENTEETNGQQSTYLILHNRSKIVTAASCRRALQTSMNFLPKGKALTVFNAQMYIYP